MMTGERARGQITTFYSFKGGAGRSMALANIGCLLARGYTVHGPVLMIDWDLEAPGLHRYFERHPTYTVAEAGREVGSPGLIELFIEVMRQAAAQQHPIPADDEDTVRVVTECRPERFITPTTIEGLHLLKAGNFGGDYAAKVNAFDWERLFRLLPGCFHALADYLAGRYAYVLIDSRTGHTDIGGICTTLMPERLVAVFTPSRQSLHGLLDVLRDAIEYRRRSDDVRQLVVFPLPSRIENAEPELRKAWRYGSESEDLRGYQVLFEELFVESYDLKECDLDSYFSDVQIQHVPRFAYGDEICVLTEGPSDRLSLSRSYEAFLDRLIGCSAPWATVKYGSGSALVEIDLGTTSSSIASVADHFRPKLAAGLGGTPATPSIVGTDELLDQTLPREILQSVLEKSKRFVEDQKFHEAREVVRSLPEEPQQVAQLRKDLLSQIEEAEQAARLSQKVDDVVERSKELVAEGCFEEARKLIRGLPTTPRDLLDLKKNLLGQINKAQEQSKVHEQIEKSIRQSKTLVEEGKFEQARKLIRELPDTPKDLVDFKKNLLGQINQVQEQSKVHEQIEKTIKQSKTLVGRGRFEEARKMIRGLPDTPKDLTDLKKNLLGQIDEVEVGQQRVSDENARLMDELTRRGADLNMIHELAKMNNLDISNPHALNALLKAIKQHLIAALEDATPEREPDT